METGRPTKLNRELLKRISDIVRAGNYIETASAHAGIDKSTLYRWLKRGAREEERLQKNPKSKMKASESIYVDFCNSIKKAIAESEMRDLLIIGKASEQDWKASAWRLERRFPERWSKKERLDANVKSEHTERTEVFIEQQIDTDPETVELVRQLWRRQQALNQE